MISTPPLVLGHDAAWSGWAWCLASSEGPLSVGWEAPGTMWRWDTLAARLDLLVERVERMRLVVRGRPIRVVVEQAPAVYQRGNQAAIGYGLGTIAGGILLDAAQRRRADPAAWLYPWPVEVGEWRAWWNLRARGRDEYKRAAVDSIRAMKWGDFLAAYEERSERVADVAEAILIAVGAAMRPELAPRGPR